jgi:hypothetical protein
LAFLIISRGSYANWIIGLELTLRSYKTMTDVCRSGMTQVLVSVLSTETSSTLPSSMRLS